LHSVPTRRSSDLVLLTPLGSLRDDLNLVVVVVLATGLTEVLEVKHITDARPQLKQRILQNRPERREHVLVAILTLKDKLRRHGILLLAGECAPRGHVLLDRQELTSELVTLVVKVDEVTDLALRLPECVPNTHLLSSPFLHPHEL